MNLRKLLGSAVVAVTALAMPLAASAEDTVRVGYMKIPPLVHIVHALETGIFKKHDLNIDLKVLNGGPELMTALASNSIDIGMTAVGIVLLARTKGLKMKAFGTTDLENAEHLHNWIITKKSTGIADLKGLEGKTVGIVAKNSPAELTVRAHMLAVGADPDKVTFVALPFPQLPAALEVGNVDAFHSGEPFHAQAMHSDKMEAVEIAVGLLPNIDKPTALGGWFASDDWLVDEKNRGIAARYLAAVMESNRELVADRSLVNAILVKEFGMPPEVAAHIPMPFETNSFVVTSESYKPTIDALAKTGMIDDVYPVDEVLEVITYE